MKRLIFISICLLTIMSLVVGCGASKKVTRIDPEEVTDLSGRWNDTDSRLVSQEMIRDCLNHPWINEHMTAKAKKTCHYCW